MSSAPEAGYSVLVFPCGRKWRNPRPCSGRSLPDRSLTPFSFKSERNTSSSIGLTQQPPTAGQVCRGIHLHAYRSQVASVAGILLVMNSRCYCPAAAVVQHNCDNHRSVRKHSLYANIHCIVSTSSRITGVRRCPVCIESVIKIAEGN